MANRLIDLPATARRLIHQMVETCSGVVAVILDPVTARCVNPHLHNYNSSDRILIYEQIGTKSCSLAATAALVFLQPGQIPTLGRELQQPRYPQYYVFISGTISDSDLRYLADCDVSGLVQHVEEYYIDYYIVGPMAVQLCSDDLVGLTGLFSRRPLLKVHPGLEPLQQQLTTAFADQRFSGNVLPAILLLANRYLDPITPLLSGCRGAPMGTYQSLLHELVGIQQESVAIAGEKLSLQDEYFTKHMYDSYTELVESLSQLRQEVTTATSRRQEATASISGIGDYITLDLRRDIKNRKLYAKHAKILLHLSDLITQHQMVEVALLEQKIACQRVGVEEVTTRMIHPATRPADAMKLAAIYAIRHGYSVEIVTALLSRGLSYDPIAQLVTRVVVSPPTTSSSLAETIFGADKPLERYSPELTRAVTSLNKPVVVYLNIATYLEAKMARDLGITLVSHRYVNSQEFLSL